jgi:hypothetical protein
VSIWKLTPVDPSDPNWLHSSYCGIVIVRATNERVARKTAAKAFDIAGRFPLRAGVRAPPWLRPALVRAERIESPLYTAKGSPEVLEPKP